MGTIFDYLTWRGDLPLCEPTPLNELDAVILSRFSNLPFYKVFYTGHETMGSFCRVMEALDREEFQLDEDIQFIHGLEESKRYSSLKVTDYVKDNRKDLEMQFAAITIHLPDDILFISFCGTDSTLLGWKENFNMSFQDNVPAQCAALSYVANALKQYPETKGLYLGGHSKGGNLAVYSSVCLPKECRSLVLGVYSCDGPGFSKGFIATHPFEEMDDRIHTFLPTSSTVGRILEHAETYEVVNSVANSVYQHNLYTWVVERTTLSRAERADDNSEIFYNAVRHLIEETTPHQREFILNGVYSVVTATEMETPKEVSQEFGKLIPPLMREMRVMNREDWQVVSKVFRAFLDAYVLAIRDVGLTKVPEEVAEVFTADTFQEAVSKLPAVWNSYRTRSSSSDSSSGTH